MARDVHVHLDEKDLWSVTGSDEMFETREDAEDYGRWLASRRKVDFVLHDKKGNVSVRYSYSQPQPQLKSEVRKG